jgi:hypothetical protein
MAITPSRPDGSKKDERQDEARLLSWGLTGAIGRETRVLREHLQASILQG